MFVTLKNFQITNVLNAHRTSLQESLERANIVAVIIQLMLNQRFTEDQCEIASDDQVKPKLSVVMRMIRESYDIVSNSEIDLILRSFCFCPEELRREHLRQPRKRVEHMNGDIVLDSPFGPGVIYKDNGTYVTGRMGRGPVAWYRGEHGIWNPKNLSADEMIASLVLDTSDDF